MNMFKRAALFAVTAFTAVALAGGFAYAMTSVTDQASAAAVPSTLTDRLAQLEGRVEDLETQIAAAQANGLGHAALPAVLAAATPIAPFLDEDDPAPNVDIPIGTYSLTVQPDYEIGDRVHLLFKLVYPDGPTYTWDDFVTQEAYYEDPERVIAPLVKQMIEIRTSEAIATLDRQRTVLANEKKIVSEHSKSAIDAKNAEIAAEIAAAALAAQQAKP